FASSRKFIWDAQGHDVEGNRVLAMSFYPKEGEPLWSRYSTHAIIHTLNVYSRYTFPYPYPVAISVNGPVGGMEYPMICFNGPRPEPDGTYSERTKYALISVIIHEVGHNYFPMIVNSDERQWTWMDEGINTFLQYLSEQEWEDGYPSRRGEPKLIVGYMRSRNQVPIMTQSDSILQFGNNAYAKPATALNILRETILGRELFDYAFKEYARRWRFKRPTPADFFRTMEDASGVDLDWFWRGWFYTTDHVDLSVENLHIYTIDKGDPDEKARWRREEKKAQPETLSQKRNRALPKRTDQFPELKDFYDKLEKDRVTDEERAAYRRFLERLTPEERKLLQQRRFFHVVEIRNAGGLVMPVILELEFENGKKEEVRIPAEIWRRDNRTVRKLLIRDQPIRSIVLDPHLETADVDRTNNYFPRRPIRSRFQVFKDKKRAQNAMQKARAKEAKKKPPKPAASGEKAAKKRESG
ncbi:MAG TPA: aminopeptidase, partial [Planctomycetaceae bacterium]|nr:aminopeptidase [Planctomycetaceae bacterium]